MMSAAFRMDGSSSTSNLSVFDQSGSLYGENLAHQHRNRLIPEDGHGSLVKLRRGSDASWRGSDASWRGSLQDLRRRITSWQK